MRVDGGGIGSSKSYYWGEATEDSDITRGVGYIVSSGGRIDMGRLYGELGWNLYDATPSQFNSISIGYQAKTPHGAFIVPVLVASFIIGFFTFGGFTWDW